MFGVVAPVLVDVLLREGRVRIALLHVLLELLEPAEVLFGSVKIEALVPREAHVGGG